MRKPLSRRILPGLLALGTCASLAYAHDDAPAFREAAARRAHWDGLTRTLADVESLRDRGDRDGALRRLAEARALAPEDARGLALEAAFALEAGRNAAADSFATLAVAHGGNSSALWRTRALARANRGDATGALPDFDRAIEGARGHDEELVLERAQAAHRLLGAAAGLASLERDTRDAHWTPARRALAGSYRRALGQDGLVRGDGGPTIGAPDAAPLRAAAVPYAVQAAAETLVARGAAWKWFAGPALPTGAWTSPAYDDAAWSSGPAPLGYGEARIATALPDGGVATNRWITTCLRLHFTRASSAAVFSAVLQADYDDGFVAWLDGVEIARRGLPTSNVVWSTLASNHESGAWENIPLPSPGLLANGGHVLAIELHQTSASSSDLLWDATLLADTANVARTRGPYLQNATPSEVSVRWRTAAPLVGRVSVGPAGGPYLWTYDEASARTEHEVRVTGLAAGARYAYSVHGASEPPESVSEARTFGTPPLAGADVPVRLWAIGDSGYGTLPGQQVRDAWLSWSGSHREDLWVLLGDNAYTTGTDAEYQSGLFDEYPLTLARSPLWSTRGNHDLLYAGASNDYYDLFTLPTEGECGGVPSATEAWYSFDWGPVHFVCLDSEGSDRAKGSPMLQWLRVDLAATTQPWVVGFWHHPPYTKGSHDSDDPLDSGGRMRDMRENVLPILDSLGVDLVLGGHSHSYERSALLREHYGTSGTLAPSMLADAGDGRADGAGPYRKSAGRPRPREGVVYAVNGSAAQVSGGTLDHPAMIASLNVLGSMVVDVVGARLDARFLDATGVVRDSFSIVKSALVSVPGREAADGPRLAGARPAPFTSGTDVVWELPRAGAASLMVYDVAGRRVRTLASGRHAAGEHVTHWDGRDRAGRRVAAGAYLLVLEADGVRRVKRVVRLP
ncbi:MAG: metallophosphoesterase [Candidatus Eisenbacteria bacterium]|uniref:Metallophosphoesterase n=1 Tax=Eiseniibacteriota bacterium TaxID=2212470 RepID=A0A933SCC3_UNCEI|nr:metallophosphoesterase [Candidatus Eisenbacteria bacterium]